MSPRPRWQSKQRLWTPLEPYVAMEAVADLSSNPESFAAYARRKGLDQNAVSEAVKEQAPELHAKIVEGTTGGENKKRGASFETALRGMLRTRGYYVLRTYASKSAVDLLAVGLGKPNLMVQAKKDGKLYFNEWNKLWEMATQHGCWPVLAMRPPDGSKGALYFRLLGPKVKKGQRNDGMLLPFDPKFPDQDSLLAPPMAATA